MRTAEALERVDPRLKILLGLLFGVLAWSSGPLGLSVSLAGIAALSWVLLGRGALSAPTLRGMIGLVLVWCLLKAVLEWNRGAAWGAVVPETAVLGGRLLTLILLGLCLTAVTSSRQLGRGAASFLRPVLGSSAWKAALGLALMVHYLPLCMQTLGRVRLSLALRARGLPVWLRLRLFVQTALRWMAVRTWDQTVALASRGLDRPDAWEAPIPFEPRQWLAGLGLAALALLLAWL